MPIVFVLVPDPVGPGFVDSLARPGGNVTGFTLYEFGMGGKWLELLKQIAPRMTRAAFFGIHPRPAGSASSPPSSPSAAAWRGSHSVNVRDPGEIERGVAAFARTGWRADRDWQRGAIRHRELIVTLAARHNCPRSIGIAASSPPAA